MRGVKMELLRRFFSMVGFDCMRRTATSPQSSMSSCTAVSQESRRDTRSSIGSLSLGPEQPHCQSCISYDVHLKRLSCGHIYCNSCSDRIVNLAFLDIEGLSDYPCPMCKSIRHLGFHVPDCTRPGSSTESPHDLKRGSLQHEVIKEEEGPGD